MTTLPRRHLLVLCAVLMASCADRTQRVPDPYGTEGRVSQVPPAPAGATPALLVFTTDRRTDGTFVKIRGTLKNPLSETVSGARLVLDVYSGSGTAGEKRETLQHEVGVTLAPGASAPFRWDAESMYFTSGNVGADIRAYPKRVGPNDVPPPPGWR